ncbi:MAG: hypothetical protein HY806_05660 [Nitrospirae bacterium]|nr:hypothetical protein [Nitrospirota bacterium]MBI4838620.1 hypothetical protein [Nitrospirota bacterium]
MGKKTFTRIAVRAGSLVIAFFFIYSLYTLHTNGLKARVYYTAYGLNDTATPITLFKNSYEVDTFYKTRGVHGRVLVNFGRFLNFVGIENDDVFKNADSFPVKRLNIMEEYEKRLTARNFLWIAMQGNIIREIDYVLPDAVFEEKGRTAWNEQDVFKATPDRIIAHEWGSRRILSNHIPDIIEPVVLNIDASFFSNTDAVSLAQEIKKSALKADVVTLNLSEDNPDVTEKEREELRKFAELLKGERE